MDVKRIIQHQAPVILVGAGIASFITAVVLSAKAGPRAEEALEGMEEAPIIEKVKVVAPIYAPTVAMCMIGTGCIIAGSRIQSYRYASLLALYSLGRKNMDKIQEAILDEVGPKKAEKIRASVTQPGGFVPQELLDGGGQIFFDTYCGRYFSAPNVEVVRGAINDVNQTMFKEDFAPINDFYYILGLPNAQFGDVHGWSAENGAIEVTFDPHLSEGGTVIISVSFRVDPRYDGDYGDG